MAGDACFQAGRYSHSKPLLSELLSLFIEKLRQWHFGIAERYAGICTAFKTTEGRSQTDLDTKHIVRACIMETHAVVAVNCYS